MAQELLIVGAGITGSLTASLLARARPSLSLTVWDKARGAGGRMSTRRDPSESSLHVDMGAQYISRFAPRPTDDAAFTTLKEEIYAELLKCNVLRPLSGTILGERSDRHGAVEEKLVATKGMSSVAKYFLEKSRAKVLYEHQLHTIQALDRRLTCKTADGASAFDGVILTMPVPQILALNGNILDQLDRAHLEAVKYSSRYALGLTFNGSHASSSNNTSRCEWSMKYTDHPIIRFLSWDTSKRGSGSSSSEPNRQTLLVHTSVPFAMEHLEMEKDQVEVLITKALNEVLPGLPEPNHSHLIRWRYSQVSTPYTECPGFTQLCCGEPLVLAAGDGFIGSNFENCLRSAQLTAQYILSHF